MWTSQVYWHHDKMARTKTYRTSQNIEYTKTQPTLRNNIIYEPAIQNPTDWNLKQKCMEELENKEKAKSSDNNKLQKPASAH